MTTPMRGSSVFGPLPVDTDELLREHIGGLPLERTLTDTGNGYRFRDIMLNDVRYAHDTGTWYVWDGHRLRADPGGKTGRVFRDTEKVIKSIRAEADDPVDGVTVDQIIAWATRSSSVGARQAMMTSAAALTPIAVTSDELDGDPWLLGVQNGVIDLHTGDRRDGVIDDLITQQAAVAHDKDAGCPLWESHIDYISEGKQHVADYLQRAAGYTLTGLVSEHVFFFLHGQGGTGKSAFVETLQMMLGDYGLKASQRMLAGSSRAHTTELTDIKKKRLAFIDELEDDATINEARVKMIASNAEITARGIARDDVTFPNVSKLWICSNAKPHIRDTTDGTWRRMKAMGFWRVIDADRVDKDFMLKLRGEWPGILNWCIAGLRSWRDDYAANGSGLVDTAEITSGVAEYRLEEDPVRAWLDECCERDENAAERSSSLWRSFRDWCVETNRPLGKMNDRQLGRALSVRGFDPGKRVTHAGKKDSTWIGVRLTAETIPGITPKRLTREDVL